MNRYLQNTRPLQRPASEKTVEKRYDHKHPPETEEEAVAAISRIEGEIVRIETNINTLDVDSYPTASGLSYHEWKRLATNALGRFRAEVHFLNGWLKVNGYKKVPRPSEESKPRYHNLEPVVQKIGERAKELAAEINQHYSPVFTPGTLPTNLASAQERSAAITALKLRLQDAFAEITASWGEHKYLPGSLPAAKAPLQRLLAQMEQELVVVKNYIRNASGSSYTLRSDWKQVCVEALTRAQNEGFVLNEDEKAVLAQLRIAVGK